jgi:hypothetical protein
MDRLRSSSHQRWFSSVPRRLARAGPIASPVGQPTLVSSIGLSYYFMSTVTGLGDHPALRYFRWAVAIILGLLILGACWMVQSAVQEAVQKVNDSSQSIGPPPGNPQTASLPNWDGWAAMPHPPRAVTLTIQVTDTHRLTQLSGKYALTLRPNDQLVIPVRQGLQVQNTPDFLNTIVGAISFSPADSGLTGNCADCVTLGGDFYTPTFQQNGPSSDMLITSGVRFACDPRACDGQIMGIYVYSPILSTGASYGVRNTSWTLDLSVKGWSIVAIHGFTPLQQTTSVLHATIPISTRGVSIYLSEEGIPSSIQQPPSNLNEQSGSSDQSSHDTSLPVLPAILGFLIAALTAISTIRFLARHAIGKSAYVLGALAFVTILIDAGDAVPVAVQMPQLAKEILNFASIMWWSVLPFLILLVLLSRHPVSLRASLPLRAALFMIAVIVVAVFSIIVAELATRDIALIMEGASVAIVLPAIAAVALGRGRWSVVASATGALMFAASVGTQLLGIAWLPQSWWIVGGIALMGLLWTPTLVVLANDLLGLQGRGCWVGCAVIGIVLFLPVSTLLTNQSISAFGSWDFGAVGDLLPQELSYVASDAVVSLIIVCLVFLLRAMGGNPDAEASRTASMTAVLLAAVTVSPVIGWYKVSLTDLLASVAALLTFACLLPRAHAVRAVRLASVSRAVHSRLMRRQLRERLMLQGRRDLHRSARSSLARGDLTIPQLDRRWRDLERANLSAENRTAHQSIARLATQGSSAGFTPWANGVAGALGALALAAPIIVWDLYESRSLLGSLTLAQVISLARHVFRWVFYGFFYGYFYPRIPGSSPIKKALFLLVAILPPELLLLLLPQTSPEANLGLAALVRSGEAGAFCIGLSLFWEWRLSYAAGLPWSMVRNFRNVASLVTPLTTIFVAVAAAIATVLANAATVALLHTSLRPAGTNTGARASTNQSSGKR